MNNELYLHEPNLIESGKTVFVKLNKRIDGDAVMETPKKPEPLKYLTLHYNEIKKPTTFRKMPYWWCPYSGISRKWERRRNKNKCGLTVGKVEMIIGKDALKQWGIG